MCVPFQFSPPGRENRQRAGRLGNKRWREAEQIAIIYLVHRSRGTADRCLIKLVQRKKKGGAFTGVVLFQQGEAWQKVSGLEQTAEEGEALAVCEVVDRAIVL